MSLGEIVSVTLNNGEIMYVEVDSSAGDVAWSRKSPFTWEEVKASLTQVSRTVLTSVREGLPESPGTIEVEYGLKLVGESGKLIGVLAKVGAEAAVTIRLSWDTSKSAEKS